MVHRNIKYFALFLVLFSLIVLPGCKVGPKYVRPAVKADNIYRFANSGDTLSIADLEWVTLYKDTVLHQLVTNGLKNNYDIRIAFARISEAQAAFKKSRGDQWPMFSLQANAGAYNQQLAGLSVEYQQYNALAGMSWEIDLWGKYRRAKEAARANLMAQTAFRQMVRITLIHDIVGSYFNLLELDNELRIIRENIIIRQKSLDLVKAKMIAGTASGLVVAQAEAELAQVRAQVPAIELSTGQMENLICILLGEQPHAIPRGKAMLDQLNIPQVSSPGVFSQLIVRRPDIIEAEQNLVAANANIGVARAQMLPTLQITAGIGTAFNPTNLIYSAVGGLIAPIFGGGKLRQGVKVSEAKKEQLLYSYQKTIITSLKEVSDALLAVKKDMEIVQSQQVTVNAAQTAFDLSNQLYNAGYASYLDVINAQQLLFQAQVALSVAQLNEITSQTTMYKALGGGWK